MRIRNVVMFAAATITSLILMTSGGFAKPAAGGEGFKLTGVKKITLTDAGLAAAEKTATHGIVSGNKKSLTLRGNTVRVVVTTGPEDDMLSYRISGLRNPTLIVAPGTLLKILFVNTDEDMTHDLRLGVMKAPFSSRIPRDELTGSALLAHRSKTSLNAEEVAVRVPSRKGAYSYLCTVPGHAAGGMYGALTVR